MATEITTAGYQSIQDYIRGESPVAWSYISLRDASDAEIVRIPTSHASVTKTDEGQFVRYVMALTGAHLVALGVTLPVTVAGLQIFNAASGGSALASGTIDHVTYGALTDLVTHTIEVQVPQVV